MFIPLLLLYSRDKMVSALFSLCLNKVDFCFCCLRIQRRFSNEASQIMFKNEVTISFQGIQKKLLLNAVMYTKKNGPVAHNEILYFL